MEVRIRNATPDDVGAVWTLMRELAVHEGLGDYFEISRESLHQACFGTPRRVEVIVAESKSGIVGYATCLVQFSPWLGRDYLFLDDLYVSETARGIGIGSRIMRHLGAVALERGLEIRWHVEPDNHSAQAFYRALGAELRSKWIAYWTIESIRARETKDGVRALSERTEEGS